MLQKLSNVLGVLVHISPASYIENFVDKVFPTSQNNIPLEAQEHSAMNIYSMSEFGTWIGICQLLFFSTLTYSHFVLFFGEGGN